MSTHTTYLIRHAPTTYSSVYRVNGDPTVDVPLTTEGVAACYAARPLLPREKAVTCVSSMFDRCLRTAELVTAGLVEASPEARLNELDYGTFEGGAFLDYARWLAKHGPYVVPPGGRESQVEGIVRMLTGLRGVMDQPGPRLVIAHGLLVSVINWALHHPGHPLADVFLPTAPCVKPLVIGDEQLDALTRWLIHDLDRAAREHRPWRVDLRGFPREARPALATVDAHAPVHGNEDEATHA